MYLLQLSRNTIKLQGPFLKNIGRNNTVLKTCSVRIKRNFSFQNTIENIVRTQSGIFQTISESTPVECMQNLLLNVHATTGLPWWTTIICTTIFLRTTVTVPLAIYQHYILAKVERISMEMPAIANELKQEVAMAVQMYQWDEKMAKFKYKSSLKKQWNNLVVRDNCHPVKASLLLWFQIPMWISLSVGLRNLVYELPERNVDAKVTFMELTMGGCAWFPNLVEVDSSFILPIALGIINYSIIEIQVLSKTQSPSKFFRFVTNFLRGFSILMVPIAASVPSCLVLYWTTSSTFGLVQNLILMSPKVKRFCKVPHTPSQLQHPYRHLYDSFKKKYLNLSN